MCVSISAPSLFLCSFLTCSWQAVITLFFYLIAMFLPIFKSYRGYMLPLNFVLTYLWITCLIFSSQDYSGNGCLFHSPPLFGRCGVKHAIQAFWIIGLCVPPTPPSSVEVTRVLTLDDSVYLLFNTILEAMMWANAKLREGRRVGDAEKGATTATGTTAGGTDSGAAATA